MPVSQDKTTASQRQDQRGRYQPAVVGSQLMVLVSTLPCTQRSHALLVSATITPIAGPRPARREGRAGPGSGPRSPSDQQRHSGHGVHPRVPSVGAHQCRSRQWSDHHGEREPDQEPKESCRMPPRRTSPAISVVWAPNARRIPTSCASGTYTMPASAARWSMSRTTPTIVRDWPAESFARWTRRPAPIRRGRLDAHGNPRRLAA